MWCFYYEDHMILNAKTYQKRLNSVMEKFKSYLESRWVLSQKDIKSKENVENNV
jgi:hypothetical protein